MSNTEAINVTQLEQRLNLAYEANARALELIEALRPHIDLSSAVELPALLFNRLSQLCHVAYDATGGGDLHIPGSGIDDLRKIVDANLLYPDETS